MRNLYLNSFLLLLLFGCSTTLNIKNDGNISQPDCFNKLQPEFKTILYNAQINVTGKHLSGLLLFKKMDNGSVRTVFTNETGVTLFDFEYGINAFKVIFIIEKMNHKPVISQLKKDIGLLFRYNMQATPSLTMLSGNELYFGFKNQKETTWYIAQEDCSSIEKILVASPKKEKVVVTLKNYGTTMPDSAYIEHKTFEFNISLQKIER